MNDARLQHAYTALMDRRSRESSEPPVSLDVVRELAETNRVSDDRIELLDSVLAHPVTRDEYYFLRDLSLSRPRAFPVTRVAYAAAAAVVIVAIGLSVMRGVPQRNASEPMRGGAAAVQPLSPAAGATLTASSRFVWHAVPGATSYSIDVLGPDGEVLSSSTTTDTTAVLPPSVRVVDGARYLWVVRAAMADGTTLRSLPSGVIGRP